MNYLRSIMFNKFAQHLLYAPNSSFLIDPRVIIYWFFGIERCLIVCLFVMRHKISVNFDPLLHKMTRLGMMEAIV